MLVLLDTLHDASLELLRSLRRAKLPITPVVINYGGSLPGDMQCPFAHYTGLPREGRPRFFNEVPVPAWYEIRQGAEPFASVLRDGVRIGRIHYEPSSFREVARVDWIYPNGAVSHADHYDRCGTHYATSYYDGSAVYQTVYRGPGEWEIEVGPAGTPIVMRSPNATRTFDTLTDFVGHFLDEQRIDTSQAVINSLAVPLFVMRRRAERPNTTLFWQEPLPGETPGNLAAELAQPKALERVVFGDERMLRDIATRHPRGDVELSYLSQLDRFAEKPEFDPLRVFTLTHTDQLPGLDTLLDALPHVTFVVAAMTAMSERLHELGRTRPNLRLLPGITRAAIRAELERASVYLDINDGAQVMEVVRAAYHLNLLVLALAPVAKAPDYALVFEHAGALASKLGPISRLPLERAKALEALHLRRGPQSSPIDYRRLLEREGASEAGGLLASPVTTDEKGAEGPTHRGH